MEIVKPNAIPAPPALAFEDVEVPDVGGVRVRSLLLSQRLAFRARIAEMRTKMGGDAAVFAAIPELLEVAVVDATGSPIYSRQRWDEYGATHEAEALDLFNTAMRLSGLASDDAKKN